MILNDYGKAPYFKEVYPKGNLAIWRKMRNTAQGLQLKEKIVEKYIKPNDYAGKVLAGAAIRYNFQFGAATLALPGMSKSIKDKA